MDCGLLHVSTFELVSLFVGSMTTEHFMWTVYTLFT